MFADLIGLDERFELVVPPYLGLVCFRLKGDNKLTNNLLDRINADGRIHLVAGKVDDTFFLRFAICNENTDNKHVQFAYDVISELVGL
ncbi:Aromatic-L-amino-acid decarboxylase [Aphelenchoides bicaudatus]|nr:Aromatic-L-amino-acid decarboxylase [Aphelenchoides bicaudatus]